MFLIGAVIFLTSGFSMAESTFLVMNQEVPKPQSRARIRERIRSAKNHLSTTRRQKTTTDLAYIRCVNDLRDILSGDHSIFKQIRSDLGRGKMLFLSPDASPEVKAQYNRVLRSCNIKKDNYQQASQIYRTAQINYLDRLSSAENRSSKWKSEKFKLIYSQKDLIELLFRRINRATISQSKNFWGREYTRELQHLKNLDTTFYNEFVARIKKRGWPVATPEQREFL